MAVDVLWLMYRLLDDCVSQSNVCYHFRTQDERSNFYPGYLLVVPLNPKGRINYTIGFRDTSLCNIPVCLQAIGRSKFHGQCYRTEVSQWQKERVDICEQ